MKVTSTFPDADFFKSLLSLPYSSIAYTAHKLLAEKSGRNVIQCSDGFFDVHQFAAAGQCTLTLSPKIFSEMIHAWDPMHKGHTHPQAVYFLSIPISKPAVAEDWDTLSEAPKVAWYDIAWCPSADSAAPPNLDSAALQNLELVIIAVPRLDGSEELLKFLLSDSHETGSKFIITVEKHVTQMHSRIWVFASGRWKASTEMFQSVASVTFDSLVMTANKGTAIKADVELFFKSQQLYQDFGLPWKRGYLLTGPPGNGKTHLVKALINHITSLYPDVAPLYVKSLASNCGGDHAAISNVFTRARQRPCLLVLEDLDTLITDKNRAVFLNELDGFQVNHGVVVIATTNHPDKLDPALRDRPSRFDRRYQFELPDAAERALYLEMWTRTNKHPGMGFTHADVASLSLEEVTGGFSYAYLKELLLSSAMQMVQAHFAGAAIDAGVMTKVNGVNSGQTGVNGAVEAGVRPSDGTAVGEGALSGGGLSNGGHAAVNGSVEGPVAAVNGSVEGPVAAVNGSVEVRVAAADAAASGNGGREAVAPAGLSVFGQVVWIQAVELRKYIRSREEESQGTKKK